MSEDTCTQITSVRMLLFLVRTTEKLPEGTPAWLLGAALDHVHVVPLH